MLKDRVSTNLTEQISRRFQEGFQEKSRTCLHCFGLLCNVPNLLVCLNIEQKHDMQNMGAVAKIKRATSFLNKRSGTQFHHDWKPIQSIIDILHFQEDHTNSRRFPGFPGVVDTLKDPVLDLKLVVMPDLTSISQRQTAQWGYC